MAKRKNVLDVLRDYQSENKDFQSLKDAANKHKKTNKEGTDQKDTPEGHTTGTDQRDTPEGHTIRSDHPVRPSGQTGFTGADQKDTPQGQTDRPQGQTTGTDQNDDFARRLFHKKHIKTKYEKVIMTHLLKHKKQITTYSHIGSETNINPQTVRKILNRFKKNNIITKRTTTENTPGNRALEIIVNEHPEVDMFIVTLQDQQENKGKTAGTDQKDRPQGQTEDTDRIDKNSYLSASEMKEFYPKLYAYGFTEHEYKKAIKKLKQGGGSGDLVFVSLRNMELEITQFDYIRDRKTGKKAGVGYLVNSLATSGYFSRHPDVVDPELDAKEKLKEEEKKLSQAKKRIYEMRLEWARLWQLTLSKAEQDAKIGDLSKIPSDERDWKILKAWEHAGRPKPTSP